MNSKTNRDTYQIKSPAGRWIYRGLVLLFTISFFAGKMQAQNNAGPKDSWMSHFHSFNTFQVLNGKTTTSVGLNTVNGFQFGTFFTGVGTGFDYYYHVTVPLFIEARIDLVKRKGKLQLFGNGGVNFPFSVQNKNFEFKTGDYKTGSLYGAGLDYLIPSKKEAFIMGAAFSYKQVIQMIDNMIWDPVLNRVENIPIKDSYSLNRITIRLGWMF